MIAKREGMNGKKKKQLRYKSQFETLDAKILRLRSPLGGYLKANWSPGNQWEGHHETQSRILLVLVVEAFSENARLVMR